MLYIKRFKWLFIFCQNPEYREKQQTWYWKNSSNHVKNVAMHQELIYSKCGSDLPTCLKYLHCFVHIKWNYTKRSADLNIYEKAQSSSCATRLARNDP